MLFMNGFFFMWRARDFGYSEKIEKQDVLADIQSFLRDPQARECWNNIAKFYPAEFREWVDKVID